ncbi:RNase A-like domain-containing protein [Thalassiella azotivora]
MYEFTQKYPRLVELWVDFLTQQEDPALDPQLVVDDAIDEVLRHDEDVAVLLAELDRLIEEAGDDEASARRACSPILGRSGRPDGPTMQEWLRVQRQVLAEALAGRAPRPPVLPDFARDGLRLPRASRFTDKQTADTAVTEVLRANEDAFRAWAAARGGWARQHYYADLGREVGRVALRKGEPTVAAPACVVVMEWNAETGAPVVRTAYPEVPLDPEVRRRYPDLCHWFGGWFNQDAQHPWDAIIDVNQTTTDPARSRVRDQLRQVLTIDDDDHLIDTIESCGSYALPTRMRWWVQRTLWRLDAYDWLGTRA